MSLVSRSDDGKWYLQEIGADLDKGRRIKARTFGVLMPSNAPLVSPNVLGINGADYVSITEGKGQGEGGEREGREGSPEARSRASDPTPPEFSSGALTGLPERHLRDLVDAIAEYRQFKLRIAATGAWLTGRIQPIPFLEDGATVVLFYPFDQGLIVRAWAWWDCGVWVGPRHTNYGDGSICAFEPTDPVGVWRQGDPLLQLLDLFSCWIARQIYLLHYRRWPGPQSLHTAFERVNEHRAGEFCGCGAAKLYENCHQPNDLLVPQKARLIEFRRAVPSPSRTPPRTFADCAALASQRIVALGYAIARFQIPRMTCAPSRLPATQSVLRYPSNYAVCAI